jgi:hypothetical protein
VRAPSPRSSGGRAYPSYLVEVEQGGAEEQQRREHEVGEEHGNADGVVGLRAEHEGERDAGHPEEQDQRRQRAGRVDVVGAAEPHRTANRRPHPRPLDERHRHDEPGEAEPCHGGEGEPGEEERGRHEHHRADEHRDPPAAPRPVGHRERGRHGVPQREHRREGDQHEHTAERVQVERELVGDRERKTQHQRRPETPPVEPDRLGDELTHRARRWRQRRRQRLLGSWCAGSAGARHGGER